MTPWWCGLSYCCIEFAVLCLVLLVYLCFVWVCAVGLCGYFDYGWVWRIVYLLCFVDLVAACICVTVVGIAMLIIGAIGWFGFDLRL